MTVQHGKLSELKNNLAGDKIDVFFCSASFEERGKSIANHLDLSQIGCSIVATNVAFRELIAEDHQALREKFQKPGSDVKDLLLDANDPIKSGDAINDVVSTVISRTEPQRFLIDITTFTRESLLMLVRCLKWTVKKSDTIEFIYAHAKEYSVGDLQKDKWLSKGIREVRSVLGFPGDLLPSQRSHLIILVGFETERALSLIRECEPAAISLGLPDGSEIGTRPHQDTNVYTIQRLKSILDHVDEFAFKAYDAEETRAVLQSQVRKRIAYNTIIAPMNTKISTLGAALLALDDPSIQLCYAQANIYNYKRYSTPDDDYYLINLAGFP